MAGHDSGLHALRPPCIQSNLCSKTKTAKITGAL